jgi:hypothetical protein
MSSNEAQPITKKIERNIFTVLENMIRVIPLNEDDNFKYDLNHQLEKAAYTPPENMYAIWKNVQSIITARFKGHSDTSSLPQWCILLLDIWTNKKKDSL